MDFIGYIFKFSIGFLIAYFIALVILKVLKLNMSTSITISFKNKDNIHIIKRIFFIVYILSIGLISYLNVVDICILGAIAGIISSIESLVFD
ncbi:hypothetical protein GCM10008904_06830 [Paraclostridium ghonii]|uniref:Uncharacterized protein n=1 Tax=Paraclostridium ghonii TaxID=29358 RepID=A0ABU0N2N0_9FIRM|nr:hypothetical protein [Paeniclostridium ghonii]MDQ0557418.1 hypothetical protein [Paeniclostridium ghonii]